MFFLFKNFKFLILVFFILFLSCPTDMVKYTTWKGTYVTYDNKIKKLELIFDSTSKVTALFELDALNNSYSKIQSDYTLTENYTFSTRKFEADMYVGGFGAIDHIILEFNGTLDYFKNIGEGKYKSVIFLDGSTTFIKSEKKWEVRKLSD